MNHAALTACQAAQYAQVMRDTCKIGTVSLTTDGPYPTEATPSYGSEIACAFWVSSSVELNANGAQVPASRANVLLPADTSVSRGNTVCVTKKCGVALSPNVEFSVDGDPVKLGAFIQCSLVAATTGGVK